MDKLISLMDKVPKGVSLQLKLRRNKNRQTMLYICLDGKYDERCVYYEKALGLKNAIEHEDEIIKELIEALFKN